MLTGAGHGAAEIKESVLASAAGRVNLLGEHTDYNDGLVLPTAIPQHTRVSLRFCSDRLVRAFSTLDGPERVAHEYILGQEARGRGWLDYVQGVTWLLASRGVSVPGFDLHIESQIPAGSGLSSSAALLVSLLRGLREALSLELSDIELARLAQTVENEFIGAPVGILDPMACALAETGIALFLDTRTLAYERLALPQAIELVVIHSGVRHHIAPAGERTGSQADYRTRRAECERAAKLLGVKSLRDLVLDDATWARIRSLEPPLDRRVRHVLTENARVEEAVRILRTGAAREEDWAGLGALFAASHRSQRDDYEVSVPQVDRLVEIGISDPAIINQGARLTGGGFGGSVVMLARTGAGRDAACRIATRYAAESGQSPTILVPELPA